MMLWRPLSSAAVVLSSLVYLAWGADSSCTCSNSGDQPSSTSEAAPSPSGTSGNSTSSGQHFLVYINEWNTPVLPDLAQVKGWNVFALSFLTIEGPKGQAENWANTDKSQRQKLKKQYNDAGIKVIISIFGETDEPTTAGQNPTELAQKMAQWVIDNDLDGIDVNYEDLTAMNLRDGKAEEWVSVFTKTLRSKLPQGEYILTHAPLAPWFSPVGFPIGYRKVHENVGDMIDWYNIQFYNQGEYTDCEGLINKSSQQWPQSSLKEINSSGIPQGKLVLGKPVRQKDASNGQIPPETLATCIKDAKAKGWEGGIMAWQYSTEAANWIKTVRSQSWPVDS